MIWRPPLGPIFHSAKRGTSFPICEPGFGGIDSLILSKPQPTLSLSSRLSISKCKMHWGKFRSSWRRHSRGSRGPTWRRSLQGEVSWQMEHVLIPCVCCSVSTHTMSATVNRGSPWAASSLVQQPQCCLITFTVKTDHCER